VRSKATTQANKPATLRVLRLDSADLNEAKAGPIDLVALLLLDFLLVVLAFFLAIGISLCVLTNVPDSPAKGAQSALLYQQQYVGSIV